MPVLLVLRYDPQWEHGPALSSSSSAANASLKWHRELPRCRHPADRDTSAGKVMSMFCSIWRDAQVEQQQYRYYKPETRGLDQEGLLEDLSKGKPNDVVLLHACAHNPTGAPFPFCLRIQLRHESKYSQN